MAQSTTFVRTIAPWLAALAALYSASILLRGQDAPGGGLVGGLVLSVALILLGAACGADRLRRAVRFDPARIAACGVLIAAAAGLPAGFGGAPYLSAMAFHLRLFGSDVALSTALAVEVGVYLATAGTILTAAVDLLQRGG